MGPEAVSHVHSRLLRLALGVEESRAYWANLDPDLPLERRATVAFEQRWFGAKSLERVRFLLSTFALRYDAFPGALDVLRQWRGMDPQTRRLICHWHLQLADPVYRDFTSRFLIERRELPEAKLDREIVRRWVQRAYPDRWSAATNIQFASKLLSAASEAGLLTGRKDPRALLLPKVTDHALGYLLYLLRGLALEGPFLDNPYLLSVGLSGGFLYQRLRALPGIDFRQMGALMDLEWAAPDLARWADRAGLRS